jgi:hypothetical protein
MANKGNTTEQKNQNKYLYFILGAILVLLIGYLVITNLFDKNEKPVVKKQVQEMKEPQFRKDGTLKFISAKGKKEIVQIDIETALTEPEQEQGLMYRKSMDELRGMLFVFPNSEQRSFWMRNTYISLDIIYVSKDKELVKIVKNAVPRSEKSLLSEKDAMYVVEVNGGFCESHGIKEGDFIDFEYGKR